MVAPLLGRLLYGWIRVQVAPADPSRLGIDPVRPVCYVLEGRHLANLLVLEQEVLRAGLPSASAPLSAVGLRRSVIFLDRQRVSRAATRHDSAGPGRLARLVRAVRREADLDVQLVPALILWGRAPSHQDSAMKALFADAWEPFGALRQAVSVLLHGRQTFVQFGAPISVREAVAGATDDALATREVARGLEDHFTRQREAAIGPDLSHRRTLIESILCSEPILSAVAGEARAKRISIDRAQARARRFAWAIASDYSHAVVRAFELVLERIWNRIYDGIEVCHLEAIARIAPGHGLVYLPCHRSHADYLLLSFVVHRAGLAPPYVAAGDNLNLPFIGPLLRRAGAFFLKRRFKGETLYAAVFREYLHTMLSRGFPMEYFIEGGRSRSGRTLAPRSGLLGMTLDSRLRDPRQRPLALIPVYIGYEKLLEGRSYVSELEGWPKRRESLRALGGSWRLLRRRFGKAYLNFGEPLIVDRFLEERAPGWASADANERSALAERLTPALAEIVARRINAAVVVNPINLLAIAIVDAPHHALDERLLCQQLDVLEAMGAAARVSPRAIVTGMEPAEVIACGERLGAVSRFAHPLGDIIRVAPEQLALLTYFRNNVLHAFALPGLAVSLLGRREAVTADDIAQSALGLLPFLRAELFLDLSDDEVGATVVRLLALLAERGLVERTGESGFRAPEPNTVEAYRLELLARSQRQMLERHYLVQAVLAGFGPDRLTRERLVELVCLLGQRLTLLFESATPEFYERTAFASYVDTLASIGLIKENADGRLSFDQHLMAPARLLESLLPPDVLQAIRRVTRDRPDA